MRKDIKDIMEFVIAVLLNSLVIMVIWNFTIVNITTVGKLSYIDALFLNILVKSLIYRHKLSTGNIVKKFVDKL